MSAPELALEIVTPDGVVVRETDVEYVVIRRREPAFELGSEIAVYPRHAPLLVRLAVAPVRYHRKGVTSYVAVGGGFAEVLNDAVSIVTLRCLPVASAEKDPASTASAACNTWRAELADLDHVGPPSVASSSVPG